MSSQRAVRTLLAGVVAAVGLVACGGGGGSDQATPAPTTTAPESDPSPPGDASPGDDGKEPAAPALGPAERVACVAMVGGILVPLSPDPERTNEVTLSGLLPHLDALATRGPEELRVDALTVADRFSTVESWDPGSGERPDYEIVSAANDLQEAYDRLIDWAAGTCGLTDLFWGCAAPMGFIVPGRQVTESTPAAGLTPEDALTGDRSRAEEVARSDDQVVFAWTDDRGLALRREVVVAVPGGWAPNGDISCRR